MTENQAKKLIKIAKIVLALVFLFFIILISVQSIQISKLNSKNETLQSEYNLKQSLNETYNNEIENIEDNFNKYSEEELRKENYKKENETFIK